MTAQEFEYELKSNISFRLSFIVDFFLDDLIESLNKNGYMATSSDEAFEVLKTLVEENNQEEFNKVLNFRFNADNVPQPYRDVLLKAYNKSKK